MLEGDAPKPVEIPEDRPAPPKRSHESQGRRDYPAYEPRTGGKKFDRRDKSGSGERQQGGKFERFAPAADRGTRPVFRSRDEVSAQSHEPGMVRLSMNSGADQMVRPADVVGFILNESALPREALGAIHILPQVTLFDVREEAAQDLVGTLRGKRFKGRKLIVGLAANG